MLVRTIKYSISMKTFSTFCSFLFLCAMASAQSGHLGPQTLIMETFATDPVPTMLPAPSGDDDLWVNYDVDQAPSQCVSGEPTPQGWYFESDLGYLTPDQTSNYAFTSCSFLDLPPNQSHNRNWLIIRHLFIPDTTYSLCWRSLAFQGPMYLDGYKVLASTASNDPSTGDFTDLLFEAAQMISPVNEIGPLELSAYNFSPGYIQANGFTDTTYYFLDDSDPLHPFYRGRLEPHVVSLKPYAGQSIYIAFLHDSDDDNLIQLDDIIVSNEQSSAVSDVSEIESFRVIGNPARTDAYFTWRLKSGQKTQLHIFDQQGRLMASQKFDTRTDNNWHVDTRTWAPGIYFCTLETPFGKASARLVKI